MKIGNESRSQERKIKTWQPNPNKRFGKKVRSQKVCGRAKVSSVTANLVNVDMWRHAGQIEVRINDASSNSLMQVQRDDDELSQSRIWSHWPHQSNTGRLNFATL